MTEELSLIVELFKDATGNALWAYVGYLIYGILKIAIIIFPSVSAIKHICDKVFSEDN